MNALHAITFSLLLANLASALSLFPELTNISVAATTNREVARSIAFDGTNFLVVFQGDNLYAGANPTNQLAAQLLSEDGALVGSRIDLQLNGSVPLVAFGASNYLMVWAQSATVPGIYGQLLNSSAAKQGGVFLIQSNADISEIGSVVFAHGQFCIVWSTTNATDNESLIQVQRVSASGDLLGAVLSVGSASSDQQFPHIDRSATNFFLVWVAQRSDTNAWDVLGRFIEPSGSITPEFVVSQTPASAPYPAACASDGTNHLVVWSREDGPSRLITISHDANGYVFTNVFFPMLFGRVLGETHGPEFSISRARWGQVSPTVAFDGTNYLVAWNDHRYSLLSHANAGDGLVFIVTNQTVYFQFLDRHGTRVETEFIGYNYLWYTFNFAYGARTAPSLVFGNGHAALLWNYSSRQSREAEDVRVIALLPRDIQPPHLAPIGITNGMLRLQISNSRQASYTVFATTNLYDWPSATNFIGSGPMQNIFEDCSGLQRVDVPIALHHAFFRAVNGIEVCKSNLRRIAWAKEQWALDNDKIPSDTPTTAELRVYAPESWICPNTGYYFYYSVNDFPTCTYFGHVLP